MPTLHGVKRETHEDSPGKEILVKGGHNEKGFVP